MAQKPLAVLKPFSRPLVGRQLLLVTLSALASLSLWWWFYLIAEWLNEVLILKTDQPLAIVHASLAVILFIAFKALHISVRSLSAQTVAQLFYQRYFDKLANERWALIRQKPFTSWQDVSQRHLPALEQYLLDYQSQLWLVALMPLFVLTLVLPLSGLAAATLIATLPLVPLFMWMVGVGAATVQRQHVQALDRLGSLFIDRLIGQQTIRLLNQTSQQLNRFAKANTLVNRKLAEVVRLAFLSTSVLDFFSTIALALLAVFIGFSLLGEINFGFWGTAPDLQTGLFILLIAPAFFAELKRLGKLYHVRAEAIASVSAWQDVLGHNIDKTQHAPKVTSFFKLSIQNAIINGYEGDKLLTVNTLHLNAEDKVLITGASGTGKTVLLDALAGIRPITGQLTLNDQSSEHLRALLPLCFYSDQKPPVTAETVADNIGLKQFARQDIIAAIQRVGLSHWLDSLPKGIDTPMGDFPPLSGGQRQRFALARLVLFNQPLVLLDEPLAHLSPTEQQPLLQLINELCSNKTLVMVSHNAVEDFPFNRQWQVTANQWVEEQQR